MEMKLQVLGYIKTTDENAYNSFMTQNWTMFIIVVVYV